MTKVEKQNLIGGIILVVLVVTALGSYIRYDFKRSKKSEAAYKEAMTIKNKHRVGEDFINVDYMYCLTVEELYGKERTKDIGYSKRSQTCVVNYPNVRVRKSRIRSYTSWFSIRVDGMAGKQVEVIKHNIEHCKVFLTSDNGGEAKEVDWQMACDELDNAMR